MLQPSKKIRIGVAVGDLLHQIEDPYTQINRSLKDVREAFHRSGRIADANAKLDETVKLMAIHYAYLSGRLPEADYAVLADARTFSLTAVNRALSRISQVPPFVDGEGRSIFGHHPATAFEQGDEELAYELFKHAGVAITVQAQASDPLDVVNEAFGHHVRDNFRSNTEDAQYMTPPEVVEFMVALAREVVLKEPAATTSGSEFLICDPSCGVGSFLLAWHRLHELERRENAALPRPLVIGQDKVDRMARLAKANLIFSGFEGDNIFLGSSLNDDSSISKYNGRVDLILTNPPFGARFETQDLRMHSRRSLPHFSNGSGSSKIVDSECLFIERYLTLLRPGGLCLVVVPDSIISAKGLPALVRQLVVRHAELMAVVELPPVTFAQAGTRTKTSVLMFRKNSNQSRQSRVFFSEVHSIGFEVSRRKGVALKRAEGVNELPAVLNAYREGESISLASGAFAHWRELDPSAFDAWTPRRFQSVSKSKKGLPRNIEFEERPLEELVKPRVRRKPEPYEPGKLFISVLHVIGEGVLDISSLNSYRPVTPGIPVDPGSVIVSRINPRIPRVMVVPDLGARMLCSSEFEILEPVEGISPYALAFLLLSEAVQEKIRGLTAGTSASHSRVRSEDIRKILIPWPDPGSERFKAFITEYEQANRSVIESIVRIDALRRLEDTATAKKVR